MRIKKNNLLLAAIFFISTYILLYYLADKKFLKRPPTKTLNGGIYSYGKALGLNNTHLHTRSLHYEANEQCEAIGSHVASDIQIFNVYKELRFDNVDGGAWKQGWNVQVDKKRWNSENKLKVFVVPHSHNDPGWIKTFEQYYESQTRYIFNNMVNKLSGDSRRKFIWAEVSYLSLWWNEVSDEKRKKFKQLVDNGQIEIVAGGWVMPDESSSHYYSVIQQLTHGHQWLRDHLQVEPKQSWSIDPFGVSPTMPFILSHFGLESLVIQRTHYAMKKYLAQHKQLEFRWRQNWDGSGSHDFFTHMMPFYSYDIPHTCGPDPAICCQFDFKRSPKFGMSCPWKKPPVIITDKNVAFRAELLLDQYRKKAELYSTSVLLIPLGDDFRYDVSEEWDLQYKNYQKLFDYMNNNPSLYVEAKFGTLKDYFEALKCDNDVSSFPSLQGDFFTYADVDDHYWSGYFTSRPFYKRMDREFIYHLRSAEILHAIAWKSASLTYSKWLIGEQSQFIEILRNARASLSLFQHHDGIAGTAKDHVMLDYAHKLEEGMNGAGHVMQQSINFILNSNKETFQPDPKAIYFDLKKNRKTPSISGKHDVLNIDATTYLKRIVIFNSLTWYRSEVLNIKINNYKYIEVLDDKKNPVPYQISPFCEVNDHSGHCYLLHFKVELKPLEMKTYFVTYNPDVSNNANMASLRILNGAGIASELEGVKEFIKIQDQSSEFSIQNDKLSVTFRPEGLIKAITLKKDDLTVPVHLNFIKYSCRRGRVMSGAYLFLPDGESRIIDCASPLVKIIEGKLISNVIVYCDFVIHTVYIYNIAGSEEHGIEIQNLVDIRTERNFEIAMKLSTNIKNEGLFYTDLNGYQIIKRQHLKKLPLQANYYPMPSTIFIEDQNARVTLVSAQPHGAASLNEGEMEVMMDRRLEQDDQLGLGQGVLDNRPILHIFRLVVEKKISNCKKVPDTHLAGYLSMISYLAMNAILYPIMLFVQSNTPAVENDLLTNYNIDAMNITSSIDVHLVSMTTLADAPAVGFVLHRIELDTCFHQEYERYSFTDGMVNLTAFIPMNKNDIVRSSSLSFVNVNSVPIANQLHSLCAMDMAAFYVSQA